MTKPFYAEYANHAMRFYARNTEVIPYGTKAADVEMWESCQRVVMQLSERDKAVILAVYRSKCSVNEAAKCISEELNMSQNKIWQLIVHCTRLFAKERGLI